jgi:hypothetical protein
MATTPPTVILSGSLRPLNGSGVTGTATAVLRGTQLTVIVRPHGQTPGQPRPQHIHIGGRFTCPPTTLRGHGVAGHLRTSDAKPYHGPPIISLTSTGDTGMSSDLAVARYPVGDAPYQRTVTVSAATAAALRAGHGVLELHGVDYNHDGRFDGAARSDLNPSLPEEATDPSACTVLLPHASAR